MTPSPTPGRTANGRFAAGNSGRPKGARNRHSLAAGHEEMRLLNVLTFAFLHRHYPEAYAHLTRSLAAAHFPIDLRSRRKTAAAASDRKNSD